MAQLLDSNPDPNSDKPFSLTFGVLEIEALIHYAAEKGLTAEGKLIPELLTALFQFKFSISEQEKAQKAGEVLQKYAQLTLLTAPVNGRTLLDTKGLICNPSVWAIMAYTWLFLILAVGSQILRVWLSGTLIPEEGWLNFFNDVQRYALDYLSPFFWGGLGACVYLMKRLSDYAAEQTFDQRQLHGWATRIWLGAILGAVVQVIYEPSDLTTKGITVNALAFLTGVGIKVVYGALEKTIDVVGQKLNLETIRPGRSSKEAVRNYLQQELAKADPEKDKERKNLLIKLLEEWESKKDV